MSSLDDKRKKPDKSYGRKPYVVVNSENDTFNDMMTTIPRKAMLDQRLEKKSQFDKPYLEDGNYSDMEYGQAPTIPSFSNPKFNFPPFPGPVPTGSELPAAWGWPPCMLALNGPLYCLKCAEDKDFVSQGKLDFVILRDGYFPGGIMEAQGIASANTTIYLNRSAYGNLDRSRAGEIKISEPAGGWNVGDILEAVTKCKDEEGNEIVGCTAKIRIFCRDKDCDCCTAPGYVAMTLDAGSTDDTIDNANPATVTVQDGCPPYTWGVSGTGYSIDPSGESDSLIAEVSVGAGTCGTDFAAVACVTVVDKCSVSITTIIRNTATECSDIFTCMTKSGTGTPGCATRAWSWTTDGILYSQAAAAAAATAYVDVLIATYPGYNDQGDGGVGVVVTPTGVELEDCINTTIVGDYTARIYGTCAGSGDYWVGRVFAYPKAAICS